jgi:histidinol phosphatase-like PHP family hydrolase
VSSFRVSAGLNGKDAGGHTPGGGLGGRGDRGSEGAGSAGSGDHELGSHDLHVHTTMSDGDLPLARVVEIAVARGIRVGIADHVSTRNMARFVATVDAMEEYLEALEAAPVLRAAELCWCDRLYQQLPHELLARLDYMIGSNHGFALTDGTMASPWWKSLPAAWQGRADEVMELMVLNLCDLVREMPVQIVAHSTLMPPALLSLEPDVEAWWTEEREDRFVEATLERGVAIEISNRYRLPHDRLLRKAKEAGATFSLGSDGHTELQIARLDWAIAAAGRAGINRADLFVPERARVVRRA